MAGISVGLPTRVLVKSSETPRLALWLKLLMLGVLAYIAASPYFFHFLSETAARSGKPSPIPLGALVVISGGQVTLFVALAAWAFVVLGPRLGLDAPVLRGAKRFRETLVPAMLAGTLATLALCAINKCFRPFLPAALLSKGGTAMGDSLLAFSGSFYGGVIEEIIMRLGVMTVTAYALSMIRLPNAPALMTANVAAALLFGVGHLPAVHALGIAFTPALVTYIILANATGGVVFGWLYEKRGIEAAMVAHFTCDVWIHVALPSAFS